MDDVCACIHRGRLLDRVTQLGEEMLEWAAAPSTDEASDIAWAIGRLIGHFMRRTYVPVPGDGPHRRKIAGRLADYGCVLSPRHSVVHGYADRP